MNGCPEDQFKASRFCVHLPNIDRLETLDERMQTRPIEAACMFVIHTAIQIFVPARKLGVAFASSSRIDRNSFSLNVSRRERDRFIWPQAPEGTACLTRAQFAEALYA